MLKIERTRRTPNFKGRINRNTEKSTAFLFVCFQAAEANSNGGGGTQVEHGASSSSPQPPPAPHKTTKGRLVISRQSMETAFAAVCKAYVPRPGQPMSRTREEVTALAQASFLLSSLLCFGGATLFSPKRVLGSSSLLSLVAVAFFSPNC